MALLLVCDVYSVYSIYMVRMLYILTHNSALCVFRQLTLCGNSGASVVLFLQGAVANVRLLHARLQLCM
jgi:hypothetical protein